MKNKVTIITINLNQASGLSETIKSVINQTQKDFEFIVIDGGSEDESLAVIKEFDKKITNWVSEKDKGIYHAMNKGIKKATGDFVFFLNSGDIFYNENVLEDIVNNIKSKDEIIYGDVLLKNDKTGLKKIQNHPEILKFNYFFKQTICHQACIIKRELFDRLFYFNESYKIASDWEFLIYAIFKKEVEVRKINLIISVYDTTGISVNPKFKQIAAEERKKTLDKFFPQFIDDYKLLMRYSSPRAEQLLQIEKSGFARRFISIVFIVVLFFINKKK